MHESLLAMHAVEGTPLRGGAAPSQIWGLVAEHPLSLSLSLSVAEHPLEANIEERYGRELRLKVSGQMIPWTSGV